MYHRLCVTCKQNVINNVIGWIQITPFGITDKRHAIYCIDGGGYFTERNGTERNGTKVYNAERNWSKIRNATDVPISVVHAFVSLFGNFVYKYCN